MDWQLVIVGTMVTLAVAYLGRQVYRSWQRSKSGCAGGCGCQATQAGERPAVTWVSTDQLTARLQLPKRPE